ncbi:hypothetical protein RRF57_001368 [Xylaria bambusicola]|uniref:Uncharacterized protein n=1 Tax=Xylaria bambusicola TaxID=326684 RepID=A0AAN7Z0P1_9PEZI
MHYDDGNKDMGSVDRAARQMRIYPVGREQKKDINAYIHSPIHYRCKCPNASVEDAWKDRDREAYGTRWW